MFRSDERLTFETLPLKLFTVAIYQNYFEIMISFLFASCPKNT